MREAELKLMKIIHESQTPLKFGDLVNLSGYSRPSVSENLKRLIGLGLVIYQYADKTYYVPKAIFIKTKGRTEEKLRNQVSASLYHGKIIQGLEDIEEREKLIEGYIKAFSYLLLTDVWGQIMDDPSPIKIKELLENWITPLISTMAITTHANSDLNAVQETLSSLNVMVKNTVSEYDSLIESYLQD